MFFIALILISHGTGARGWACTRSGIKHGICKENIYGPNGMVIYFCVLQGPKFNYIQPKFNFDNSDQFQ